MANKLNIFIIFIWDTLLYCICFLHYQLMKRNKKLYFHNINNILLYHFGYIGDTLTFIPTICATRKYFPKAKICFLIGTNVEKELLEKENYIDEFINVEYFRTLRLKKKISIIEEIKLINKLRKYHFDLTINSSHRASSLDAALVYLIGTPIRVGFNRSLFTIKLQLFDNIHEIERNLNLIRALGINITEDDKKRNIILWNDTNNNLKYRDSFFLKFNIQKDDFLVGIQPGTKWKQRCWSIERFAEIGKRLLNDEKIKIILLSNEKEKYLISKFLELIDKKERIILSGIVNLKELGIIIKNCNLFICNDSGSMHIADVMHIPLIAIFGPGNYNQWAPIGNESEVIRKDIKCSPCNQIKCKNNICLQSIKIDDVWQIVDRKIKELIKIKEKNAKK